MPLWLAICQTLGIKLRYKQKKGKTMDTMTANLINEILLSDEPQNYSINEAGLVSRGDILIRTYEDEYLIQWYEDNDTMHEALRETPKAVLDTVDDIMEILISL